MTSVKTSIESKKLLLNFIIREINYEKECKKMMEIIQLSKRNSSIQETLVSFLEDTVTNEFSLTDLVVN
jgi:hypothetical protein